MNKINLIYYCKEKECNNVICYQTALYGEGRCKSCAQKGNRNCMFGKKRPKISNRMRKHNPMFKKETRNKLSKTVSDGRRKGKNHHFYGKKRPLQSKRMRGKNNPIFKKEYNFYRSKGGYYKNIWMRSSYEIAYAKWLDKNNIKWLHESKAFNLGNTTYTPDFFLPNQNKYIEIKGRWMSSAKIKFRLFKKLYPNINIEVLMGSALKRKGIL